MPALIGQELIGEPTKLYHLQLQSKCRQVARIIRYLRDTVLSEHWELAKPTSWMLDCLVANCPDEDFEGENWNLVIYRVLCRIKQLTDATQQTEQTLFQLDGSTPLFPNEELYDELDAHRFCDALLQYMTEENLVDLI